MLIISALLALSATTIYFIVLIYNIKKGGKK